jgi:hypothetical protein
MWRDPRRCGLRPCCDHQLCWDYGVGIANCMLWRQLWLRGLL